MTTGVTYKKAYNREEPRHGLEPWHGYFDAQVSNLEYMKSSERGKDCLSEVLGAWGLYRRELSKRVILRILGHDCVITGLLP